MQQNILHPMITIKTFIFNDIRVNTYLLYDETKECIIIDAGCYTDSEKKELSEFINREGLKLIRQYATHCHIDHIIGNNFIHDIFNVDLEIHQEAEIFLKHADSYAEMLGFKIEKIINPVKYLNEGDIIRFGNSQLEVLYTPGHAGGSICFYNKEQKFIITGDVLFQGSIGRTDLPTGNFQMLVNNIKTKLLTLDEDTIVYPGHGPTTRIGFEKKNNPFL